MDLFFAVLIKFLYSFVLAAGIANFVFLWNETFFVIEYGRLLGLRNFLKVSEFEAYQQEVTNAKYPIFLRERYPWWFTKLIGCPFCIISFLSFVFSCIISWWAFWIVSFIAILGFLMIMKLYKEVYPTQ